MKNIVRVLTGVGFAAIFAGCSTLGINQSLGFGPATTANNATVTNTILQSMDTSDQAQMNHALSTIRDKQPFAWQNAGNGNQYQVLPNRTYVDEQGQPCRAITIGGKIRGQDLTSNCDACRIYNGSWQVVN